MTDCAHTPKPPYYAVIFTSLLPESDGAYQTTASRMLELAREQPGFLGVDSARDGDGLGITVSYWRDAASIQAWRQQTEHLAAQQRGRQDWYRQYQVRVARVERAYGFTANPE